jgi:signal transduction histidine kinase
VWIIGVGIVGAAVGEAVLILQQPEPPPWLAVLVPSVAVVYGVTGLMAWVRRPSSRLGFLIVVGGGVWLLAGLDNVAVPVLSAVGVVTQTLALGVIVHLLLAFPTGRLHRRAERVVVVAAYAVCLVLQVPQYLFASGGPLSIADRPQLAEMGLQAQRAAGAVVVGALAVVLVGRLRSADVGQRRVLAPLAVYGIFALLAVPVSSAIATSLFDGGGLVLPVMQLAVLALVPIAFAVSASRGGFARTADIAELGAWLGADEIARPALRRALAATLGDGSLELLFRLPGEEALVDDRGAPVSRPAPGGGRGVVGIDLAGTPVGAIVYDAEVLDSPEEIREAGRVVALAVDRERLIVQLRASRSRIAAAADDERRRIARDLHDGLQSRLVFLAVQAGTGAPPDIVRGGIEAAIDELRELVDGVMPAQLTERGLPQAVEDLADRLPTPVVLDVAGLERRLAPEVETAAYFVVCEAVVNAVKHAGSSTLAVSLQRIDGRLRIEVADRGGGGVAPGRGMRGMADRVEAVGGVLAVHSSPGVGTRIEAVIPCES